MKRSQGGKSIALRGNRSERGVQPLENEERGKERRRIRYTLVKRSKTEPYCNNVEKGRSTTAREVLSGKLRI